MSKTTSASELEKCANCGHVIGRLETPHIWQEQVVCAPCHRRLEEERAASDNADAATTAAGIRREAGVADTYPGAAPPAPVVPDHATAAQYEPVAPAGPVRCPACGSMVVAKKVDKSSVLIAILLLLLWILPGILYMMFCTGYVYECPRCGAKIADA